MPAPKAMVAAKYREVKTHRNMIDVQFRVCEDKAVVDEADGVMNLLTREAMCSAAQLLDCSTAVWRNTQEKHMKCVKYAKFYDLT